MLLGYTNFITMRKWIGVNLCPQIKFFEWFNQTPIDKTMVVCWLQAIRHRKMDAWLPSLPS